MGRARSVIAVLGDGGWGTTLAIHLHRLKHDVRWWGAFPDYVHALAARRENIKYLPGVPIPRALSITSNLSHAVAAAHLVILAIPSEHLRPVIRHLVHEARPRKGTLFLTVAKGLEQGTLKRMSEVIGEEAGPVPLAVLSGPNIASEIAKGCPASSVVASRRAQVAAAIQRLLSSERLRIYTSSDVTGVELGGALKNPLAIAAGISDGLGLGTNAKAALITRGVVEMARLGTALGGRRETFWGLSGLGDLITTCLSGRNHWLGEQIGRGGTLRKVLSSTAMVIEGVKTTQAAVQLARRHRVEVPIIEQVSAVLFRARPPRQALGALMGRAETTERRP